MKNDDKQLVFVSYAHAAEDFLKKELMPFLRQLELGEQIELWHDRMIGTGENWYAEIADRLDHAKVAILFVTQEFLGSKFCQHEEVPVLLQRARRGELQVLPLFAEPCFWENEPWLSRTQMWPTDGKALSEYDVPRRRRLVTEFAQQVLAAIDAPSKAVDSEGRFDKPDSTYDLHRMPQTGSRLFGRRQALTLLDAAWDDGDTNLVAAPRSKLSRRSDMQRSDERQTGGDRRVSLLGESSCRASCDA